MKDLAELLTAVGSLIWPIFALIVFFSYRQEFRLLLRRIRRGKLFGQELELEDSLRALDTSAKAAVVEVAALAKSSEETLDAERQPSADEAVQKILEGAARSPKAALLYLGSEIEREMWRLLASTGWHGGERVLGLRRGFELLLKAKALPPHVLQAALLFGSMQNRLVHGGAATDDDALRAIDSGTQILRALRAIDYESHVVVRTGVPLFSDEGGNDRLEGVTGLILESAGRGRAPRRQIFPTTKTHFITGKEVAWEWGNKSFKRAWYLNPESGKVEIAWFSSAEFTGQHLEQGV